MPPGQAGQRHIKPSHPPSTCDAPGEAPPRDSATAPGCLLLVNQLSGVPKCRAGACWAWPGCRPLCTCFPGRLRHSPPGCPLAGSCFSASRTLLQAQVFPLHQQGHCSFQRCLFSGPRPHFWSPLHSPSHSTTVPSKSGPGHLPLFKVLTLGTIMSRSSLLCLGSAREDVWDHNGHELGKAGDWLGRMVVTLPPAAGCLRLVPWESGGEAGGLSVHL